MLQRNRESSLANLPHNYDMMSDEDGNQHMVAGTPLNFNNTQGNISNLLNNSASFVGISALHNPQAYIGGNMESRFNFTQPLSQAYHSATGSFQN